MCSLGARSMSHRGCTTFNQRLVIRDCQNFAQALFQGVVVFEVSRIEEFKQAVLARPDVFHIRFVITQRGRVLPHHLTEVCHQTFPVPKLLLLAKELQVQVGTFPQIERIEFRVGWELRILRLIQDFLDGVTKFQQEDLAVVFRYVDIFDHQDVSVVFGVG